MMVGVNISDEQLGSIADRTIQEADTNGDMCISFNEFTKVIPGKGIRIQSICATPKGYPRVFFCVSREIESNTGLD